MRLYVHYPFCVRKCRYCDFLSGPSNEERRSAYLEALCREITLAGRKYRNEDGTLCRVQSVYFGGGTPSLMTEKEMEHLLFTLSLNFLLLPDAEITTECNPGTVTKEKLTAFRDMGINRISIGVQSFKDSELSLLGRIHTGEDAISCVMAAKEAGFDSVSLDLMSALPGQTMKDLMENLETAVSLSPDHISCYSLILEDGTALKAMAEEGKLPPFPGEDLDRAMYHETGRFLQEHGYPRYEISNYARPGFECRHNIGYWTGDEYLGLGLGAASLVSHTRFSNTRKMDEYLVLKDLPEIRRETEHLSRKDEESEFMILGLRMTEGVLENDFEERFKTPIDSVFGDVIQKHVLDGLLVRTDGRIRLTGYGLDVADYCLCDFM
ncbi:MAG: radical SAM family heme chaperone HemW [Lachnospiraceae bacterium]